MRAFVEEGVGHIPLLDSRAPRALLWLALKPGRLCRDWIEGRRDRLLSPRALLLLTLLLGAAALTVTGTGPSDAGADAAFWDRVDDRELGSLLTVMLVLPQALFAHWLLTIDRRDLRLSDRLTVVLYTMSFIALAKAVEVVVEEFWAGPAGMPGPNPLSALAAGLNLLLSFRGGYQLSWVRSGLTLLGFYVVMALTLAVMLMALQVAFALTPELALWRWLNILQPSI